MQNAFGKKQTIPTGPSGILAILLENLSILTDHGRVLPSGGWGLE